MDLAKRYRITDGRHFKLADCDPADTADQKSKADAGERLAAGLTKLSKLQERLYAENRWALLLIFQAMDAAGKDSTIKHVMSGVNPQGCEVTSFKAPSSEELDHDFLWRTNCNLPRRGHIGIFNRSYYEEVLVVRVHPEVLAHEHLPDSLTGKKFWEHRYEDINCTERYLARNGVAICKFFLHLSKQEQKKRFLARLDEPDKNWKFETGDLNERKHWDDYQKAYEKMIQATASDAAPWHVVPADHKWFARLVVSEAIIDTLERLNPQYPAVSDAQRSALELAKKQIDDE